MSFSTKPGRQQGVALILVLLVVALMTVVATQLGSRVHLNIQQASNRDQYQQAYWFAQGGERLARGLIEAALEADDRIHLGQAWASSLLSYPIDGGYLQIGIVDQQACFNVNALTTVATAQDASQPQETKSVLQLRALLASLEYDPQQSESLEEPLRDWLDSDTLPTGLNGGEDLYYTNLTPAYLPANGPLVDLSELNLIDGFVLPSGRTNEDDARRRSRLQQQLCALPTDRLALNINTLSAEQAVLLQALFEGAVTADDAETWLSDRPEEGFATVDEFWSKVIEDEERAARIDANVKEQLQVTSDYFQARIEVNYYDANLVMYSGIEVRGGKPVVYRRHYGTMYNPMVPVVSAEE